MATLIGRECWHVGAALSHGIITRHDLERSTVVIERGIAFGSIVVHAGQILLTLDAAIREAESSVDYWQRQVTELMKQRDKD